MKSVSDDKPNVFQNLGNGSWFYNYDFKEVDQPQELIKKMFPSRSLGMLESVKVWGYQHQKSQRP